MTESHNHDDAPKARSGAGRPPLLRTWPNLLNAILYRLDNGQSMRQVAEELEIGFRTLAGWAREGEKQPSGPKHDIAIAVNQSKLRRGLGPKRPENPTTSPTEPQSDFRVARVVGTPEKWISVLGFVPKNEMTIALKELLNRCMEVALEAAKHLSKSNSASSGGRETPGGQSTSSAHVDLFHVVHAAYGAAEGWKEFNITSATVKSLCEGCGSVLRNQTGYAKCEVRWPRDFYALTVEQKFVIVNKARILVKTPDRGLVQIDFLPYAVE